MSDDTLALYNGGSWKKYLSDDFHKTVDTADADVFMFHAGPRGILGTDPDHPDPSDPTALSIRLKQWRTNARFKIGLGLDGWTDKIHANLLPKVNPSDPNEAPRAKPEVEAEIVSLFEKIAAFAASISVTEIMADAESSSNASPSAGKVMARLFITTFRRVAPNIVISHTTYDDPCSVETPDGHSWGGFPRYPYTAWLASLDRLVSVDLEAKQNYTALPHGFATIDMLLWRCTMSDRSYEIAVSKGWVNPQKPVLRYLQVHNVSRYAIVTVGMNEPLIYGWAAGTPGADETMDSEGIAAWAMLAKLSRLGRRGPGAVDKFLDDTGTRDSPDDHKFGPKAAAALAAMTG